MDPTSIVLKTFEDYKREMLKFQEQHRLIFGDDNKACAVILKNVHSFVDELIYKINEEYGKERRNKQITEKFRS